VQTDVLIKEECILKNKNKLCLYKKLSVFCNICLKTFGSHLVPISCYRQIIDKHYPACSCMFLVPERGNIQ